MKRVIPFRKRRITRVVVLALVLTGFIGVSLAAPAPISLHRSVTLPVDI